MFHRGTLSLAPFFLAGLAAFGASALLATAPAEAQEPAACLSPNPSDWPAPAKPYFLVALDTSGSMIFPVSSTNSCGYQNGAWGTGTSTRMGHAKCAVRNSVLAFGGQVNFGLMQFASTMTNCGASCYGSDSNPSGQCTFGCLPGDYYSGGAGCSGCGPMDNINDPATRRGGRMRVGIQSDLLGQTSNAAELLSWVDNNCTSNLEVTNVPVDGPAYGLTPLNGMLRDARRYLQSGWTDPLTSQNFPTPLSAADRSCRSVNVILLTDGENHNETQSQLDHAIAGAVGQFQVDARGVGIDWKVAEIRKISQALLGTVDIIPNPHQLGPAFAELMRTAMARGVASADLRVWIPQGAQLQFVRQVSPTVEDLTHRGTPVNQLTMSYPTGSWGDEERDYHISIRLAAKSIGQEQLAARVQLAIGNEVLTQGLVKAKWSADTNLTAQINPEVAHYTGQTELAQVIQEGLAAKDAGDEATATTKLGRAVQLATETGNVEATSKLRKVLDIADARTGTVRLKKTVDKADVMALDTASTKTTRVRG